MAEADKDNLADLLASMAHGDAGHDDPSSSTHGGQVVDMGGSAPVQPTQQAQHTPAGPPPVPPQMPRVVRPATTPPRPVVAPRPRLVARPPTPAGQPAIRPAAPPAPMAAVATPRQRPPVPTAPAAPPAVAPPPVVPQAMPAPVRSARPATPTVPAEAAPPPVAPEPLLELSAEPAASASAEVEAEAAALSQVIETDDIGIAPPLSPAALAARPRYAPLPNKVPFFASLGFRQATIPVMLTAAAISAAFLVMGQMAEEFSIFAKFREPQIMTILGLGGGLLLLSALLNMVLVHRQLAQQNRPQPPGGAMPHGSALR